MQPGLVSSPGVPRWDASMNEIVSYDNGEAELMPFFVYGTNGALPLVVVIALLVQVLLLRRRRRVATRVEDEAGTVLAAGSAVVAGTARTIDDAAAPMVEITVTQKGISEAHKNKKGLISRWTTTWTEVSRTCAVRPFLLQMEAAEVRVEPDERVRLLDGIEEEQRQGPERRMVAKLEDGEKVYAYGVLAQEHDPRAEGGGYRGGGMSWVLRPERGSMLLSVGRMSERFEREARARAWIAGAFLAFFLIVQAASIPYHVALFRGHAEPAEVVALTSATRAKKQTVHTLTYRRLSNDVHLSDRVSESDAHLFTPGRIVPVHVTRFMGDDRVTLGAGASASAVLGLVPAALAFAGLGVALVLLRGRREWYDRPKLINVTDGKLED